MVDFLLPPSGSRRGTIPTQTLVDALAGELGGGNVFIFRPGGEASGNVYTSWAELHAALLEVEGPRVVFIDTSVETTAVIPVGSWAVENTIFMGKALVTGSSGDRLSILGTLQNAAGFENLLITKAVDGTSAAAIEFSEKGRCYLRNCILSTLHASLNVIKTGSLDRVEIDLYNTDFQTPGGGASANIACADTNGTYLNVYDGSRLRDNAISYESATTIITRTLFCEISSTQHNGGGTLAVSSGIFSYDRANYALEASFIARHAPWRYSDLVTQGQTYTAKKTERVLVSSLATSMTINTPASPNDGDTFSIYSLPGGTGLTVTLVGTAGVFVESPTDRAQDSASEAFPMAEGRHITWEWFNSAWGIVSMLDAA